MNIPSSDLPLLRLSATLLIVSLVTGAALIIGGWTMEHYAQQRQNAAAARLRRARSLLNEMRHGEEDIHRYLADYRTLLRRGWIGREKRLDWVETIGHIQDSRRLFPVAYELSPRQPAVPRFAPMPPKLRLFASRMKITLPLLVESDLFHFLDDLRNAHQGFFVVQKCDISHTTEKAGAGELQPNLSAACTLDWLTLKENQDGQ
ncbi:MAG TPA: hypothetical protein DEP05_01300 [Betaproteobacteria bacterium]|nr:hypothetical protein [Betaproteobacteria bacterium]